MSIGFWQIAIVVILVVLLFGRGKTADMIYKLLFLLFVVIGAAASMGSILSLAADKGRRFAMPQSKIMIHQPLGGAQGQAVEIEIQAKEILFLKSTLNKLLSEHTGQSLEKISEDTDRDFYMSPSEAISYGIIDNILNKKPVSIV